MRTSQTTPRRSSVRNSRQVVPFRASRKLSFKDRVKNKIKNMTQFETGMASGIVGSMVGNVAVQYPKVVWTIFNTFINLPYYGAYSFASIAAPLFQFILAATSYGGLLVTAVSNWLAGSITFAGILAVAGPLGYIGCSIIGIALISGWYNAPPEQRTKEKLAEIKKFIKNEDNFGSTEADLKIFEKRTKCGL